MNPQAVLLDDTFISPHAANDANVPSNLLILRKNLEMLRDSYLQHHKTEFDELSDFYAPDTHGSHAECTLSVDWVGREAFIHTLDFAAEGYPF
ncbi:MAG: hypothetical protein HOP34_00195 [Methylococcaceae bacterium]|nr:hypothetical protein [Methylococcaceae bacterium]